MTFFHCNVCILVHGQSRIYYVPFFPFFFVCLFFWLKSLKVLMRIFSVQPACLVTAVLLQRRVKSSHILSSLHPCCERMPNERKLLHLYDIWNVFQQSLRSVQLWLFLWGKKEKEKKKPALRLSPSHSRVNKWNSQLPDLVGWHRAAMMARLQKIWCVVLAGKETLWWLFWRGDTKHPVKTELELNAVTPGVTSFQPVVPWRAVRLRDGDNSGDYVT